MILCGFLQAATLLYVLPTGTSISYEITTLQLENITTLVERFSGNDYTQITFTESVEEYDSEHILNAYLLKYKDLIFHNETNLYMSKTLEADFTSRNLGVYGYIYMLEGSTLSYRICLKAIQGNGFIKLFAFDDLQSFNDYQADLTNGEDTSILHDKFPVNSSLPHCTVLKLSVKHEGFFFIVGDTDTPVTYQYNVTGNVIKLSHTDYTESCTISSSKDCSLSLKGMSGDLCTLVYAHRLSKYVAESTTTHVVVDLKINDKSPRISKLNLILIIIGGIVFLILLIVCVCVCARCCCKAERNTRYSRLYNVAD